MEAEVTGFLLSEHLVTRGLWRRIAVTEPWAEHGLTNVPDDSEWPATWIGYDSALNFCGTIASTIGNSCSLPTEVQWEHAYRCGTTTTWFWGEDVDGWEPYAVFSEGKRSTIGPVAQRKPNPWGLFDMAGLAWEWVRGEYEQDDNNPHVKRGTYPKVSKDFEAHGDGGGRMIRGGTYLGGPGTGTAYTKALRNTEDAYKDIGFRVCIPVNHQIGLPRR
jgi:formylglycine-generating enzyme required for sulfatase activity